MVIGVEQAAGAAERINLVSKPRFPKATLACQSRNASMDRSQTHARGKS
jgi:hypothetical protein